MGGFQLWLDKEPTWERIGKQTFVSAGKDPKAEVFTQEDFARL